MVTAFSQRDKRWGNLELDKSGLLVKDWGCFVVALASLLDKLPSEVLGILNREKCITKEGELLAEKASKVLGFDNYAMVSKNPKKVCIAQIDFSPKPGIQKHFVVWMGDGKVMDPWTGTFKDNKWPVISYRLFERRLYPARPPEPDVDPKSPAKEKLEELARENEKTPNTTSEASKASPALNLWPLGRFWGWLQGIFGGVKRCLGLR